MKAFKDHMRKHMRRIFYVGATNNINERYANSMTDQIYMVWVDRQKPNEDEMLACIQFAEAEGEVREKCALSNDWDAEKNKYMRSKQASEANADKLRPGYIYLIVDHPRGDGVPLKSELIYQEKKAREAAELAAKEAAALAAQKEEEEKAEARNKLNEANKKKAELESQLAQNEQIRAAAQEKLKGDVELEDDAGSSASHRRTSSQPSGSDRTRPTGSGGSSGETSNSDGPPRRNDHPNTSMGNKRKRPDGAASQGNASPANSPGQPHRTHARTDKYCNRCQACRWVPIAQQKCPKCKHRFKNKNK